jgi:lipoprotein-anchoring transpeptidase ErfK/SrfK
MNAGTWKALVTNASDKVLKRYKISNADVAGPFDKRIPTRLVQMATLPGLSYKSPREELAEKFHMSEALLAKLNPGVRFDRAGADIVVADVRPMELHNRRHTVEAAKSAKNDRRTEVVASIVIDKPARDVRAYDKEGKLLGFYPATIGSREKPAPSGTFAVRRVARNPDYHYDPKFAWKGVKTNRPLTIRPGPNNPVGLIWIDLTAPSYGIHGTPDPEKIGKTASHGCIRLTNWDAVDLGQIVRRGTMVKFEDQDSPVVSPSGLEPRQNTAQPAADR